jgi:enolase
MRRQELAEMYMELLTVYPVILLEDPFEEESFDVFAKFTASADCQVRQLLSNINT